MTRTRSRPLNQVTKQLGNVDELRAVSDRARDTRRPGQTIHARLLELELEGTA